MHLQDRDRIVLESLYGKVIGENSQQKLEVAHRPWEKRQYHVTNNHGKTYDAFDSEQESNDFVAKSGSGAQDNYKEMIISAIEAFTGAMQSMPYSEISIDDLLKLYSQIGNDADSQHAKSQWNANLEAFKRLNNFS